MMANWLLVWVFAAPSFADAPAAQDGWRWETDLDMAQRTARQTNRLVLIHFGGPWCEPCQRLEQQVFNQPGFGREFESKYVAVKVDPHANPALAAKFGVRTVPTDVVITARGQLIYKVGSPTTPAAYAETMNRIAASVMPFDALQSGQPRPLERAQSTASATQSNGSSAVGNRLATAARYEGEVAPPQARTTVVATASGSGDATAAAPADLHTHVPAPDGGQPAHGAHPPFALECFCPVTLVEKRQWLRGDMKWGAVHRGRTYLFISQDAQKAFLANPDRYSPVFSGNDPVMRVNHNQIVPGRREHGAFFNERVYLFSSEETFRQFDREPNRYAEDVRQAMRR